MVKKYITTLKNGAREQKAFILGRSVTLRDGEVVSEGILTKTFPSLFEEIIDVSTPVADGDMFVDAVETKETFLTEDSSDVQGFVESAVDSEPVEATETEEKAKKPRAAKAAKAK